MASYLTKAYKRLHKLQSSRRPKVVSLFSGCGGLDLTFHKAGYNLVWANDLDESACKTFRENELGRIVCGSIEDIDLARLPRADVVLGGFPCQDFSQIWKKPGLHGTRGNLYSYFVEIVAKTKPAMFIAENVKGLLSANKGRAIETILKDFRSVQPGYVVVPKLVNFADFGVPQLRERVLLFGIRINTRFNFCLPAATHDGKRRLHITAGEALAHLHSRVRNQEDMQIQPRTKEILKRIKKGGNFTDIPKDDPLYVKGMISHVYRRIDPDKPSTTIIAAGGGGTWGYHWPEPRALTNRERARIQGFPDKFRFEGSFGEIRKQIGNAVPPVGMIPFVNNISAYFEGNYAETDLKVVNGAIRNVPVKTLLRTVAIKSKLSMRELAAQLPRRLI